LFDNKLNFQLVIFLLEAVNNMIQYQYEGNGSLIYAILQAQHIFWDLENLPLPEIHEKVSSDECKEEKDVQPDSVSTQVDNSIDPRNTKFVPTAEWVESWKAKLPLQTTLRLLEALQPQLEDALAAADAGALSESDVMEFLKSTTLVGLLPVPHPIVIRRYQSNSYTAVWFSTYIWGNIFLRSQSPPLFEGGAIALFKVNVLK